MESRNSDLGVPLSSEQVAAAEAAIGASEDLEAKARCVLETVQAWASPTLVVCLAQDRDAEHGWRTIPELTSGIVARGFEESFARQIGGTPPEALTRPRLIQPMQSYGGVKVKPRDSWLLPWTAGAAAGYLILRGVPRPYPANLAESVSRICEPLWPLVASSAEWVEPAALAETTERPEIAGPVVEQAPEQPDLTGTTAAPVETAERPEVVAPVAEAIPEPPGFATTLESAAGDAARLAERLRTASGELRAWIADRVPSREEPDVLRRRSEQTARDMEELRRLRERVAEHGRIMEESRAAASRLEQRTAELEQDRQAAQVEARDLRARIQGGEASLAETAELRGHVSGLEQELGRSRDRVVESERELEQARAAGSGLQQRIAELEQAGRGESVQLEEARAALKRVELTLAYKEAAEEENQRHIAALTERAEAAEADRRSGQSELAQEREQVQQLRVRLEQAEARARTDEQLYESRVAEIETLRQQTEQAEARAAAAERDAVRSAAAAGEERASASPAGDWDRMAEAVSGALTALRRTPFVPPTLRVAFSGLEEMVGATLPRASRAGGRMRLLLLDRNITRLETVATEMEAQGLEPLLAHYPEEVAFFLKTPEGTRTSAVVCDVMAFRPEQDLPDLFRAWRREVPGLAVVLTYQAESPIEEERIARVPQRAAGRLPMPPTTEGVLEAIRKAQAERGPEGGPLTGAFRPPGGR